MVRNYKKKNTYQEVNEADIERAIKLVLEENESCRHAAEVCGIKHTTLFYRLNKIKNRPNEDLQELTVGPMLKELSAQRYGSKFTVNQVFSKEEELLLENYILKCSSMNYGLTYKMIRTLAYQYARHLGSCPKKWDENKLAGIDWLKGYMKRHSNLSLRKPENTSLARTLGFNKQNVEEFQKNLSEVLDKYKFHPENILNLDETGVMTVIQAPNVVARKGSKQVGQVVSGERGTLVTMVCTVTAAGNTIPPAFIFPRSRMHDSLMSGAVPGSLGLANSPKSGWITNELFLKVLEHVAKHTRSSIDLPILLIMDNHESHCNLDVIQYARNNGIVILTIPPHCSHRLQPLDVSILGPFKRHLATVQNDWLTNNPGRKISIHDLAGLASKAFDLAFTRQNIMKGFQECGIWPYSTSIFTDSDFLSLNRPVPNQSENISDSRTGNVKEPVSLQNCSDAGISRPSCSKTQSPSCSKTQSTRSTYDSSTTSPGPEIVRPLPDPESVEKGKKTRIKGKSRIWTNTPEKNRLEEEKAAKEAKKLKKEKALKSKLKRKLDLGLDSKNSNALKRKNAKKSKKSKLYNLKDSESDISDLEIVYNESDDSPYYESFTSFDEDDNQEKEIVSKINPLLECYYAVFYDLNWYLGRVVDFPDEGLTKVKFLKQGLGDSYEWPAHDDTDVVQNHFIFYGPIKLIGNGPFNIEDSCRRRIIMKYRSMKNNRNITQE